jgi:nitrate reductase gamma subunit
LKVGVLINFQFMALSLFLGQVTGISLLLGGICLLLNAKHYEKTFLKLLKDDAAMFVLGLILLIAGAAMVLAHNVWGGWALIVSIVGWAMLIKGLLTLLIPKLLPWVYEKFVAFKGIIYIGGAIWVILGGLLCYYCFLA